MYFLRQPFRYMMAILLLTTVMVSHTHSVAQAKKKSGTSVKAMEKEWEANGKSLATLLEKARSRKLFTPEDANTLNELMKAGAGIQAKYAGTEEGATILYDLGTLYLYREKYFEAYDMFNSVKENHDGTTLGRKAVYQISRIKATLGNDFAMLEGGTMAPAASVKKPPAKK